MMIVKKTPEKPWPRYPIPDQLIRKGEYRGEGLNVIEDKKECTSIGIWDCDPVEYKWDYEYDEYIYMLKGEVTINEIGGDKHKLCAGDFAYFPRGTKNIWNIEKPIRNIYIIYR
ncbi:MAG: cupin domain-containing protein [Spirochaetota bacterium]|nr:MAG: cupin domain-containing protein [Spirochaetota bacterium]